MAARISRSSKSERPLAESGKSGPKSLRQIQRRPSCGFSRSRQPPNRSIGDGAEPAPGLGPKESLPAAIRKPQVQLGWAQNPPASIQRSKHEAVYQASACPKGTPLGIPQPSRRGEKTEFASSNLLYPKASFPSLRRRGSYPIQIYTASIDLPKRPGDSI